EAELPFMATEDILMEAVAAGGDRQDLHERIRVHSLAAAREVKERGRPNDLIARLAKDVAFDRVRLVRMMRPEADVGLAPRQVDEWSPESVSTLHRRHRRARRRDPEISV